MKEINADKIEEIIVPNDLKTFLTDIVDGRLGFKLLAPWKYSEETLGVVVPIIRENAPDRRYITMYEVLKELNMKDTGSISQIELQNRSGMAIFVRAGTIFKGKTQPRAVQHSGVYSNEKETINVRCVNASYGINRGTEMEFGDIAPPSVTMNLMGRNQSSVWGSVRDYTKRQRSDSTPYGSVCSEVGTVPTNTIPESLPEGVRKALSYVSECKSRRSDTCCDVHTYTNSDGSKRTRIARVYPSEGVTQIWSGGGLSDKDIEDINRFASTNNVRMHNTTAEANDLLGHLEKIKKSQSLMDDMMQKVPLFDNQVGAIIFNAVGIIALETFDSPKSWESIKKEIIEKYGDKIKTVQSDHLYELKPEMIKPALEKFIKRLETFNEKTIKKDDYSETREVTGDKIVGEYTLVKGQPIHVLLLRSDI